MISFFLKCQGTREYPGGINCVTVQYMYSSSTEYTSMCSSSYTQQ